jgi:hypothetical protein
MRGGVEEARRIVSQVTESIHSEGLGRVRFSGYEEVEARRAISLAPDLPAAHRLLGDALLEQTRFRDAALAFGRALELKPDDREARQSLTEARRLAPLLESLPLALGREQRTFRLSEVPQRGAAGLFVLLGTRDPASSGISSPQVRYFAREGGTYRETFRTSAIAQHPAFGADAPIPICGIEVADLQRSGRQQVVLVSAWVTAGCALHTVDIFEINGKSLRHVLAVPSDREPALTDLDGDKRPEIRVTEQFQCEDGSKYWWYDVYRYDGRRYVRANPRFPEFARKQLQDLLKQDETCPGDWPVLEHIAIAYRDLGDPKKASAYQGRARIAKMKGQH